MDGGDLGGISGGSNDFMGGSLPLVREHSGEEEGLPRSGGAIANGRNTAEVLARVRARREAREKKNKK